MKPKIILLNGASSSGKSTLSTHLKKHLEAETNKKYGIISIDNYLIMSVNDAIYEENVFDVSPKLCEAAMNMAKAQINVIVDHVITSSRIFLQLVKALESYDLYMIHITCPLHELRRREQQRGNRCENSAEVSQQYLFPTKTYDLTLDTFITSAEDCVQQIKATLLHEPKAANAVRYIVENNLNED